MSTRHGSRCAARWRERADGAGWPAGRLVDEIAQCCSVSRLRGHRLAHGWTLVQAVQQFQALCATQERAGPRLDPDQLRVWETKPDRRPQASTTDLLCRLYRCNARDLGLEAAGDYSRAGALVPANATELPPPSPVTASGPASDWLEDIRRGVDRTLAMGSVTTGQLDLLDERLLLHRRQYIISPPQQMLTELIEDLREVQLLAGDRQPASVQLRLSEMTAVLATLVADALMKLGSLRQAGGWYATALSAADDSGRRDLRARVRVQAAMLPYYYGPLDRAVQLAYEARLLVQNRPTQTGAFAAAAEARARARSGDTAGAERAMRVAQEVFTAAEHPAELDAWAFPERRLLLYLSGALTYLGQTRRAREVQSHAHSLYAGVNGSIDPALLRIEGAICLARERHLNEACELAGRAFLNVPAGHRTQILEARVRDVIEAVPRPMRSSRSARELDEILALPTGAM
ncbi:hypothetical protein [Streptomyces sp. H27-D2]|uniref:hypothetical protein n=1 Tax=Streptomyces sp. H27-D2 TaxID=3046304 RepID=UPI002DBB09ED|nr:hypothetical protein [Streptomyces sp. H27-D2]MEC4020488.1 hypothetical protein [Streptomyces sp. H27-D2]